jgi:hypothetical protein
MVSNIQRQLLNLATDIASSPADDLIFIHTIMAQCALPAAKPPKNVMVWERRQGRATLLVEAGRVINPKSGHFEQLGLPYGPKARLLLMHLNSEAVRRQSPIIPVEDTMTAFFRRLMGRSQDGRELRRLKTQLSALAAAQFRLGITGGEGTVQVNTQIVGAFNLWLEKDESQRVMWPSYLKPTETRGSAGRAGDCGAGPLGSGTRHLLLAGPASAPRAARQAATGDLGKPAGAVRTGLYAHPQVP